MARINPLKPVEKLCVRHGAQKTLAVLCDGEKCHGFVRVPLGQGKYWSGCEVVLDTLSAASSAAGLPLTDLLHENL